MTVTSGRHIYPNLHDPLKTQAPLLSWESWLCCSTWWKAGVQVTFSGLLCFLGSVQVRPFGKSQQEIRVRKDVEAEYLFSWFPLWGILVFVLQQKEVIAAVKEVDFKMLSLFCNFSVHGLVLLGQWLMPALMIWSHSCTVI